MKSIRQKITVCLLATVLTALLIVGGVSIVLNYRSTLSTVEQMMRETAVLAAERIEQELTAYKNVAMDAGFMPQLSDEEVSIAEKQAIIDERVAAHGFARGNVLGMDGRSIFSGTDFSDRDYFQRAIQGNVSVSEPIISKTTGELSIIVAAPLYENGEADSHIVGVVYFAPKETFLNDIVSSVKIGKNSHSYMINSSGYTIADTTLETITTQNIERESQTDSSLREQANIHSKMRQGENGFGSFHDSDGARFAAYAPVSGTDGWSVAVTALENDYLADTYVSMIINVVVVAAFILLSIVVALKLSNHISLPMQACVNRMKQLVNGDLKSPIPQNNGQDEVADLARSTGAMVQCLQTIITDVNYLLTEMAHQNFDVQSSHRETYVGEFQEILLSMRNLKVEMSNTLRQIDSSAGQVSAASGQVSAGAQVLSQGSMTQASSVQELAATIADISDSARKTAAAAEEAGHYVELAGAQLGTSVEHVKELNSAMEKISESSKQISKIIATIENIAFQTNILALNAAVEAARAGTAGKGFAVVADEVRSLASKSDEAAKATKELIGGSIIAVSEGGEVVANVTQALEKTNELAGHVSAQMNIVVEAVASQTTALSQVTEGVDQISSVVQTNSATAQESAATSEELSAEAVSLKQLVDQFTLAKE